MGGVGRNTRPGSLYLRGVAGYGGEELGVAIVDLEKTQPSLVGAMNVHLKGVRGRKRAKKGNPLVRPKREQGVGNRGSDQP